LLFFVSSDVCVQSDQLQTKDSMDLALEPNWQSVLLLSHARRIMQKPKCNKEILSHTHCLPQGPYLPPNLRVLCARISCAKLLLLLRHAMRTLAFTDAGGCICETHDGMVLFQRGWETTFSHTGRLPVISSLGLREGLRTGFLLLRTRRVKGETLFLS
jgi:hypothetical protein